MRQALTKYLLVFVVAFTGFTAAFAHNLYHSFTTIEFNERANRVELMLQVHADELEALLSIRLKKRMSFMHDDDYDALVKAAGTELIRQYTISADGQPLTLEYVGLEVNDRTVYAYLKAPVTSAPTTYTVMNKLLLEELPKMKNQINFEGPNGIISRIIRRGDDPITIDLASATTEQQN